MKFNKEEATCRICKEKFPRNKKPIKGRKHTGRYRRFGAVTCSPKCSKINGRTNGYKYG